MLHRADCADFGCHNSIRLEAEHFLNTLALTFISFSGRFVFAEQKYYLLFVDIDISQDFPFVTSSALEGVASILCCINVSILLYFMKCLKVLGILRSASVNQGFLEMSGIFRHFTKCLFTQFACKTCNLMQIYH